MTLATVSACLGSAILPLMLVSIFTSYRLLDGLRLR